MVKIFHVRCVIVASGLTLTWKFIPARRAIWFFCTLFFGKFWIFQNGYSVENRGFISWIFQNGVCICTWRTNPTNTIEFYKVKYWTKICLLITCRQFAIKMVILKKAFLSNSGLKRLISEWKFPFENFLLERGRTRAHFPTAKKIARCSKTHRERVEAAENRQVFSQVKSRAINHYSKE